MQRKSSFGIIKWEPFLAADTRGMLTPETHSVTEGGMTQTYRKLCDKPTVDAVEVIVESVEVIVVVDGIDIVVSVNTLTVRRAVEVEAVTVTVNVEIG